MPTCHPLRLLTVIGLLHSLFRGASFAGSAGAPDAAQSTDSVTVPNLFTGENVSLGGVLLPHVHFNTVYGRTGLEGGHELAAGHHDPVEDGWTVQGIELGLSARVDEHLEAFGNWHGFWGNESPHDFDSGFEEYFLKLKNLPGGMELRGGRYLNRFGLHNATHLHGWDWVDNYLVNGRFLGDDGQYSTGLEATWNLPVSWTSALSISAGSAKVEEHGHEEGEEAEFLYEPEGAAFGHMLVVANWTNVWNVNDFHQWRFGASGAWGDNLWNRRTQVLGAHVQYEWRKNGFAPGGDYFRWRTEIMRRDVEAMTGHLEEAELQEEEEEPAESGSFDEWGLYTSAVYGKSLRRGVIEGGLRYEYVAGADDAGLVERHRISPGLTWYANRLRSTWLRVQGNFDDIEGSGRETSVWLGFGVNWGGPEVR